MKKVCIVLEDVAAAEYIPSNTPSFGASYPPRINIYLKQGGVLVIDETYGGAVFQEWYDALFVDAENCLP